MQILEVIRSVIGFTAYQTWLYLGLGVFKTLQSEYFKHRPGKNCEQIKTRKSFENSHSGIASINATLGIISSPSEAVILTTEFSA